MTATTVSDLYITPVGAECAIRSDAGSMTQFRTLILDSASQYGQAAVCGLGGLRDPLRFRSWLVAVTMNQIRRHSQTRRAARPTPWDPAEEPADPKADFVEFTVSWLDLSAQRREVVRAGAWLDPGDRQLLSLAQTIHAPHPELPAVPCRHRRSRPRPTPAASSAPPARGLPRPRPGDDQQAGGVDAPG
jgi:hypothetical protein